MGSTVESNKSDAALKQFERALEAVVPSSKKYQEESCFAKSYHAIEQTLARRVQRKVVMDVFNATYGLKTHPARFRKMLHETRSQRKADGNGVKCETCHQPIHTAMEGADDGDSEDAKDDGEVAA